MNAEEARRRALAAAPPLTAERVARLRRIVSGEVPVVDDAPDVDEIGAVVNAREDRAAAWDEGFETGRDAVGLVGREAALAAADGEAWAVQLLLAAIEDIEKRVP